MSNKSYLSEQDKKAIFVGLLITAIFVYAPYNVVAYYIMIGMLLSLSLLSLYDCAVEDAGFKRLPIGNFARWLGYLCVALTILILAYNKEWLAFTLFVLNYVYVKFIAGKEDK